MNVLGIETSCDDASIAIVKKGNIILSNIVSNEHALHEKWGGVVPELSARRSTKYINIILKEALEKANLNIKDIDLIAVNNKQGLLRSIIPGVACAKAISYANNIPILGVHHIEGHIYSVIMNKPNIIFPHICLTVAGGHTLIVKVLNHGKYQILGESIDDSAGEAFDKVARMLGLGYPGGPIIDKKAKRGNKKEYHFKRALINENNYNFSFSGLKTAVMNKINQNRNKVTNKLDEKFIENISASFQESIVDVLVKKSIKACLENNIQAISIAGGVSANSRLREALLSECKINNIKCYLVDKKYSMDNAAMIASLGYYKYKGSESLDNIQMSASPRTKL